MNIERIKIGLTIFAVSYVIIITASIFCSGIQTHYSGEYSRAYGDRLYYMNSRDHQDRYENAFVRMTEAEASEEYWHTVGINIFELLINPYYFLIGLLFIGIYGCSPNKKLKEEGS